MKVYKNTHEIEVISAHGIRIDDVVTIGIVSSRADGMRATDISGGLGHNGQTGGCSATEPVGSEGLVAENRSHSIGGKLGGRSVGEELEDESDFGKDGEDTGDVELELLVFLLILLESVVLELLEDLVVDDSVLAISAIVSEGADVEEESVEEIFLEVDTVANCDITTRRRDITYEKELV